ncbi:MAG: tetraether lipid synthase Tes [Nanoarchaeota archaeon]
MISLKHLSKTTSVCPECLKIIAAEIFEKDGKVWIKKKCEEHGAFEDLYYGSYEMYKKAEKFAKDGRGVENPAITKDNPLCPFDCGLCKLHKSHTALANIAITNRCDLSCWYCFFYAGKMGYIYEPTLDDIKKMVKTLRDEKPVPCNALQLTGGEPTLRDDLVEIIKIAKDADIDHVQLNTNGIKMSKDLDLVKRVREAGVNTMYYSFDGVSAKTNPKNHWETPEFLKNCREAGVGVVFVPTVIKGSNDSELGDILRFGFKNIDVVRGVNFQPVSLVGMMPRKERDKHRITIPDTIQKIEEQTDGEISKDDFYPIPIISAFTRFVEAITNKPRYNLTSHFACGMATYVFNDNGKMLPITRFVDVEGLMEYLNERADELEGGMSKYVTGAKLLFKLKGFVDAKKSPDGMSFPKIIYNALIKHDYRSLGEMHYKSLFVGMMHFMDLYNYDIERVKRCCIHYAMPDGKIVPFCTFNVMPEMYRDKAQKEHSMTIEEWEKKVGKSMKTDMYKRDAKFLENTDLYKKTYSK